jgi:histidyl-tRNA synthetase
MTIKKIKGTRDIFPLTSYTTLSHELRSYLLLHNFHEMHTPIFEFESLFSKNLGLSTDIVNKEMYHVTHKHATVEDKKEGMVLRPELTASMMRAFFELNMQDNPARLFQIGPVFRHERPQKGRYREFFQCSIEIINAKSIGYDTQLLNTLYHFFKKILDSSFTLEINFLGSPEERTQFKKILYQYCMDNKIHFPEATIQNLNEQSILRILDNKDESIKHALIHAPSIFDCLHTHSIEKWDAITSQLHLLNIPYIHNSRLVRGLDYYNDLIFEFTSSALGAQNTFCGGGRYDELSYNFNQKIIPSLGAGIGIDRLLLIQNTSSNQPLPIIPIIFDTILNNESIACSLRIQQILYSNRIPTDIYFDKNSLKSSLKKAHGQNAPAVIIITAETIQTHQIIIKNMNGEYDQATITIENLVEYIKIKNLYTI